MLKDKQYYAFISYKREDEEWAKWLAKKLENYNLPTTLNGKELPKNLRPVFRDTDELSAGNLPKQIYDALSISKNLVIVCSPRSAQSKWVNKEISDFISLKGGKSDNIFPFIVEGVPNSKEPSNECFPEALRCLSGNEERLGGNVNEQGGRDAAVVKVISGMLGVSFDSLWHKHEREQKRKRILIIVFSLLFSLVCLVVGGFIIKQNQNIIKKNYELEIKNLSQQLYLIELDINKGHNVQSLVELQQIKKNSKSIINRGGLINKINKLENLCIVNIKRYPLKIKKNFINETNEEINAFPPTSNETKLDATSDYQVLESDECDIIYNECESDVRICNKLHNMDTIFNIESTFKLTNDNKFFVYSNGERLLYFYDIQKNKFIEKFNSQDLFVWFPSRGGVVDVSYDNTKVLYHNFERGKEETFIIDLLNNKIIRDDVPNLFPTLSPNGKYLLGNDNALIIKKEIDGKEICNIRDSIFVDAHWCENNEIKAVKGNITTIWEISENTPPDFLELNTSINNSNALFIESSENGKYLAVITDNFLSVWDIIQGVNICNHKHSVYYPNCLVFSKDSKKVACVGVDGGVEIYDIVDKSVRSLCLAKVPCAAGYDLILDFVFNDEILLTSIFEKQNFCFSAYSLLSDSIILENCKILKINDSRAYFEVMENGFETTNEIQDPNSDTFLVYNHETKTLSHLFSRNRIKIEYGSPFNLYYPTWLKFDELGQLYECGLYEQPQIIDGWYVPKIKIDSVDRATRYVCDSTYKIDVVDHKIFISKRNILDDFLLH